MKRTKKCKTCNACKRTYRKFVYAFSPRRLYYCTVRGEMTERVSSCVKWRKKKTVCDLSAKRFDRVERDIELLIDYLVDM